MSAVLGSAPGTPAGTAPTPGAGRSGSWWRRRRGTLALLLAVLLVLVVVVALSGDPETSTPLDPDNPGPDGTAALVEVLAEQGVEVDVVRDAAALEAAEVTPSTTVVVSSTDSLGRSTAERLREHARPGLLVLLEPGPAASGALGTPPGVPAAGAVAGAVAGSCSAPGAAGAVGERLADLALAVDAATAYPGPGCFPDGSGGSLLVGEDGEVVLGAAEALTNGQVLRADNAALGLRLLGGGDRLVWYVPDLRDLASGDAVSVRSLLPPWLLPGLVLGLVSMLAVTLWRGRRLGPLSVEALPVVVRAVETTRSRGRLYRSAGDRPHAATALRAAARGRLAERLGLGAAGGGPDRVDALVRAVAAATGQDPAPLAALLDPYAPTPTTDHDLITLAQDLDRLDREVRHP